MGVVTLTSVGERGDAALDAVADTFRRADLSGEALFASDVESAHLPPHHRSRCPIWASAVRVRRTNF